MSGATALAALRAERHQSVSAITAYLKCPRQFAHRYVFHTPATHRPATLAFGTALHEALADHYRALGAGCEAPLAELQEIFTAAWHRELRDPVPVLLDEGDAPETLEAKGRELLAVFHRQVERPHRVIAVEDPFSLEVVDPNTDVPLPARLVGVFDLVVQDADGTYRVVEQKSGARRWTQDKLTYDLQLSAYSLAASLMGYGEVRVTVQLFLKSKTAALDVYHPPRTERDRRDFLEVAAGVARAVDAGSFYPCRDWFCKGCPYAGPCMTG